MGLQAPDLRGGLHRSAPRLGDVATALGGAELYARLFAFTPSPVIALNRAVAVSMAEGPAAALPLLDALEGPPLAGYQHLPAARGDCLRRLGRWPEAATAYRRALSLTGNRREQAFFAARVAECENAERGHPTS